MRKIIMLMLVMSIVLTSCYKDKGNYAYHTINDVMATTSADTFRVTRLDTLKINPQIKGLDPGRVRYEWRVDPVADPAEPLGIGKIVVISRQRDLNEQITLAAGPMYYNLDLVMIDTVTNVSYFKHLRLQVTTAFQIGWMLLEQDGGGHMDIGFITPEDKVFHNIYSAANPAKPLPATTFKLISLNNVGLLGSLTLAFYDNEGYTLDNTTFEVTGKYSSVFYGPPAVIQPQMMYKPSIFSYGPYTVSAGKVYAMNAIFTGKLFGAAFTQPDGLGYKVAPYVAGGLSYGGIFFDQLNHRFIYDGGGTSTALKTFPAGGAMAFDLNNVNKKMMTMKAGMGWDLWPDNWYAIFKNEGDDSCFLYTINANGNLTTTPVAAAKQAILNSPDVEKSVDYLFSSTVKQMYYAYGDKLYVYDMAANQSRVVYTFPAGETITAIQMQNNTITVATYNGNPGGGTVYDLPISPTGDIDGNIYTRKNSGFEKIITLTYKLG